jgi:hypothetical protein
LDEGIRKKDGENGLVQENARYAEGGRNMTGTGGENRRIIEEKVDSYRRELEAEKNGNGKVVSFTRKRREKKGGAQCHYSHNG